jgi:hypothetical protein
VGQRRRFDLEKIRNEAHCGGDKKTRRQQLGHPPGRDVAPKGLNALGNADFRASDHFSSSLFISTAYANAARLAISGTLVRSPAIMF